MLVWLYVFLGSTRASFTNTICTYVLFYIKLIIKTQITVYKKYCTYTKIESHQKTIQEGYRATVGGKVLYYQQLKNNNNFIFRKVVYICKICSKSFDCQDQGISKTEHMIIVSHFCKDT